MNDYFVDAYVQVVQIYIYIYTYIYIYIYIYIYTYVYIYILITRYLYTCIERKEDSRDESLPIWLYSSVLIVFDHLCNDAPNVENGCVYY